VDSLVDLQALQFERTVRSTKASGVFIAIVGYCWGRLMGISSISLSKKYGNLQHGDTKQPKSFWWVQPKQWRSK
jgi:hypothetical protein